MYLFKNEVFWLRNTFEANASYKLMKLQTIQKYKNQKGDTADEAAQEAGFPFL